MQIYKLNFSNIMMYRKTIMQPVNKRQKAEPVETVNR